MTERKAWVRRGGKRPVTIKGRAASSTDSSTWSTFNAAMASSVGDGFGIMMGDGLACWDLDHCIIGDEVSDSAVKVMRSITEPIIYAERSMSGDGLHVFVESHATRGHRRGGVEFYPTGRFIALTGDTFRL